MTKALIVIGAGLLAACGHASATSKAPTARAVSVPAEAAEHDESITASAAPVDSDNAADERVVAELERAVELYRAFITRAGDDSAYAEAVARSRERIADIQDTLIFLEQGMKERGQ
ncbi:MAG TPA: hypothetical protein VM686_13745 [Polyangiaceae bacterium]|jgi:hypothetical protein|nr:hypothetical protein [Polyangiaceae bacterium]